jgi:RNA recognition motif-containing protein
MNKKLYVGNLDYSTTEDELRTLFANAGPVTSVSLVTDRMSGRSRGFAFVEMESEDGARVAIESLNNRQLGERSISVAEARPPRERSFDGGGSYGSGGGRDRRPERRRRF